MSSTVAVICSAGLAAFATHPLKDFERQTELALIILAEHLVIVMKIFVEAALPDKSFTVVVIEEVNAGVHDDVRGDVDKQVKAASTQVQDLDTVRT